MELAEVDELAGFGERHRERLPGQQDLGAEQLPEVGLPGAPDVTSCGMISSLLVQVTVSPCATWIEDGLIREILDVDDDTGGMGRLGAGKPDRASTPAA